MQVTENQHFRTILDAPLSELMGLKFDLDLTSDENALTEIYLNCLVFYFEGDPKSMRSELQRCQLDERIKSTPWFSIVNQFVSFRAEIKSKEVCQKSLKFFTSLEQMEIPDFLIGEYFFIRAMGYEQLKMYQETEKDYGLAYKHLKQAKLNKKSVLALHNQLAIQSRLNPQKHYLPEFFHTLKESQKAGAKDVEGLTLKTISRAYQRIGATLTAYEYAFKAVEVLNESIGNRQYYLAKAHLAHLMIELQRFNEAKKVIDELKASNFVEIKGARSILEELIEKRDKFTNDSVDLNELSPEWKRRMINDQEVPNLGELEEKLLSTLSTGPKDRIEIIEILYDESLEFHVKENRFKVLLSRLRKKCPDFIVLKNKKYELSSELFYPQQQLKGKF